MNRFAKPLGLAALAGLIVVGVSAPLAQAQRVQQAGTLVSPATPGIYPFMQVAPGLNLQQAAYNTALMGRAFSAFPPYAMGFAPPYAMGYAGFGNNPGVPTPGFAQALANSGYNPFLVNSLLANPYAGGGMTASMTSGGYGGYPGEYPYSSYADPYSGYLRGGADVINAQGRFLINWHQGRIMNEERRKARIENRKRIFDEYMYEQAHRIPYAEMAARQNELNLRMYINTPSEADLGSPAALNAMLADAAKFSPKDKNTPDIPLEADVVKNLNVTSPGAANGSVGILRDLNSLHWPLVFGEEPFRSDAETLRTYLPEAVRDARADHLDRSVIQKLLAAQESLADKLRASVNVLPPGQYIEARHFLLNLRDGLQALQSGTAGKYLALANDLPANAKSVKDLVQYMNSHGLQFGPAVPGQESDYAAIHHALAMYDATVHGAMTATQTQAANQKRTDNTPPAPKR